jgi:proteasome lid subunit RPN8/RPN11
MADGGIKEIRNVALHPEKTFEMDRAQLVEINPNDVVALWHTHPGGSTYPSAVDQRNMAGLGEAYGNWAYLIVTKTEVVQYDTATNWADFV